MTERKTTWARVQMLLIAMVFFGPLAVATYMYYGGHFQPVARTNSGTLLEPVVNIAETFPKSVVAREGDGYWLLLYADNNQCLTGCKDALYTIRQSRRMLGKEMDRLKRVFLHGEAPPDTVFIAEEHAGLITLEDDGLLRLLNNKKPAREAAGGYFLVDPLGNLVMYFQPDIDPSRMVDDIKRLLQLSSIG